MRGLTFDVAHLLAGSLVLVSFLQLYQDRLYALLNVFAFMPSCWRFRSRGRPMRRARRICS